FSFCVALYEALYGSRPVLAHLGTAAAPPTSGADGANTGRRAAAPTWLRSAVVRGVSEDRNARFPSMDALLAALSRGQGRVRARTVSLAIGAALVLLSLGG